MFGIEEVDPYIKARQESAQAQFSVQDYGSVGDQRPYQVVFPAYPRPEWLGQFKYLTDALRECDTLCKLTGQPFRLMRWGSRIPCKPCASRKIRDARLPSFISKGYMESRGALAGYPEAQPIAEMQPDGRRIVFGPDGQEQLVGQPDFTVANTPFPPSNFNVNKPLPVNYIEAIHGGEALAQRTGQRAYICSSFGADCTQRNPNLWVPVVYVQPGGLARRYQDELAVGMFGSASAPGSTTITQPVSPEHFQELLARGEGASYLPYNAI